jgi:recombination protein RecA
MKDIFSKNKTDALNFALSQIKKQFGNESIISMSEKTELIKEENIYSSGSINLNNALGIGGLPRGRIVEIFGPESSGKTTLALHVIAECQKKGGVAAFIDAEHALDINYGKKLGIKVPNLLVSQPDNAEQALEITDLLVCSNSIDVVIIDSVAALIPKAELEGNMGDLHVGLQARLMSQALRKLTGNVKRSNSLLIFINQIRSKIGVVFGNPEVTTGGNALKFYSSIRLEIRIIGKIKQDDKILGNKVKVKVVKNKLAPPYKHAEFDIIYDEGISRINEIIDLAINFNIIMKSGSWYTYNKKNIGQGLNNMKKYFKENNKVLAEIEDKIFSLMNANKK